MLRSLRIEVPSEPEGFPMGLPFVRQLGEVAMSPTVTLLAGPNGSGKSTLLEALAIKTRLPAIGSEPAHSDPTLAPVRPLARALRLSWSTRTHRGSMGALRARYGENPDARSHGETFLHLFRERLAPGGLYLLDEPEAALSPESQLALVSLMSDAVGLGSQFVVATHSPLLLAIPRAKILDFAEGGVREASWDDLASVRLWRELLDAPARYLRHVWRPEDEGT